MEEIVGDSFGFLALVGGIVVFLGSNFLKRRKNNKALQQHKQTKEEVLKRELDIAKSEAYLEAEESKREEIRKELSKELDKDLSHDGMVDYINNRYDN